MQKGLTGKEKRSVSITICLCYKKAWTNLTEKPI